MYIMSTNSYADLSEYNLRIPASVITSEKYFNCENFYSDMNYKKRRLFSRKNK